VLVTGFPAGVFGTNCYVVAPGPRTECLVIDPGMDAVRGIREVIAEHHLRPAAVLLTHGHLDHTWSVVPIADGYGIPAFVHPDDRRMLTDPLTAVGPQIRMMIEQLTGGEVDVEPEDLRVLGDQQAVELAGVTLTTAHAPGHTPGSIMFEHGATADLPPLLFSGDVLFEGSIGRTDLPGGDHARMLASLRDVVLPLPDEMVVLPGHGGQTTIGRERATNPFLLDVIRSAPLHRPPGKGM
jgi:glyoxylase-like metal-dependent hydrolase (beta-lactamase superfamily II)